MKISFGAFLLLPSLASAWIAVVSPRHASSLGSSTALRMGKNSNNGTPETSSRRGFLETSANSAMGAAAFLTVSLPAAMNGVPPSNAADVNIGGRPKFADESIMSQKGHGTSAQAVQDDLMYGVDRKLADKICNFNRHFAESSGSYKRTNWEQVVATANGPVTFYDSVTGKPLFVAPIGRSAQDLLRESEIHGWPSFRDAEVVWDNVRVLSSSGETVSVDGSHLGHNLPDRRGNRYCINLVSIAGKPTAV
jgi:peptide methionine sulfoxide reductase MsrB